MQSPYVERVDAASARLMESVATLDDAAVLEPSLLPGWDRSMLLTHIAANGEGIRRAVQAAVEGNLGVVYPGGQAGRDAEIEAGRAQPAAQLAERVAQACNRLSAVLTSAPEDLWHAKAVTQRGEVEIGPGLVVARLREVEVHHVDLNMSFGPKDWPVDWVMEEMDRVMVDLPQRLPDGVAVVLQATDVGQRWVVGSGDEIDISGTTAELFAWMTGRAAQVGDRQCPALSPWR